VCDVATFDTAMAYTVFVGSAFESYWRHEAATRVRSVPRIYVDMLAPETFWTVIGIPRPVDEMGAMLAGEIFFCSFESHANWFRLCLLLQQSCVARTFYLAFLICALKRERK
jgi:hypothetical protein